MFSYDVYFYASGVHFIAKRQRLAHNAMESWFPNPSAVEVLCATSVTETDYDFGKLFEYVISVENKEI